MGNIVIKNVKMSQIYLMFCHQTEHYLYISDLEIQIR